MHVNPMYMYMYIPLFGHIPKLLSPISTSHNSPLCKLLLIMIKTSPQPIISLVCPTVLPLTGHVPYNVRDDSSSDSEELSAHTPLLATADVSLGQPAPVPMSTLSVAAASPPTTQVPVGPGTSNVKEYDTMFNKESTDGGDGGDDVPLGGTARDYTEL